MHVCFIHDNGYLDHGIIDRILVEDVRLVTLSQTGYEYVYRDYQSIVGIAYALETNTLDSNHMVNAISFRATHGAPHYHSKLWNSATFAIYCVTGIYQPTLAFGEFVKYVESYSWQLLDRTVPNVSNASGWLNFALAMIGMEILYFIVDGRRK